jgi:hypothetical protein
MSIFSLSLDDQSPYPTAGLNFEAIDWCDKLIQRWPGVKIDLFVPAAYSRLTDKEPRFLSNYPDWIKRMNDLPDNYHINYHGYYHKRLSVKHGNSNNDEFQYLNRQQALTIVNHMMGEFQVAGLKAHKTFRAPGWKLSVDSANVLTELGFKIAGNKEYYDKLNGKVPGMQYSISNWDLNDDCVLSGDVFACGHTSVWTTNYFNEKALDRVLRLLDLRPFDFYFLNGD